MKVRIEQERLGPDDDPEFHLKLGRGSLSDIEFTVQLLQLRHGVVEPSTMVALGRPRGGGPPPVDEAEVLEESYRFCEGTRNRTYLVVGSGDALPTRPELVTPRGPVARAHGVRAAGAVPACHPASPSGGGAAVLRPGVRGYAAMMSAVRPTGP